MNVIEFFKTQALRLLGLTKLNGNPNAERLTYINDDEQIRLSDIHANRTWYLADGDELLNWYTNQMAYGFAKNVIYNRNKRQYFWSRSVGEMVKRVHSGIPRAIIDTLSNIVGMPAIESEYADLQEIFEKNNFEFMLCQQARPMTLVEGDGAFKINMNPILSKYPIIEYYGAEDWGPLYKSNILIGMFFKSYYKKDKDNYVLFEERTLRNEGLAIEYNLFRLGKNNDLISCSRNEIAELSELEDQLIPGLKCLLAIPNKYYFNPIYKDRGKSIYDGKLDLFDLLDEILTQAGQTNRVSTPVEYYPVNLLERGKKGTPVLPQLYNRQFVKVDSVPDGDGNMNNQITTTQPDLNFDKYSQLFRDTLSNCLIGVLSPATLGIDIAKKDNAEAQREKEKQSIFTRQLICKNETKMLIALSKMLLMCQAYIKTGVFPESDKFNISVKYDEFANPSWESQLGVLGPAWANGELSTERYVNLLWGGKLSDEDMLKEIEWLDENKSRDDFDMERLMEHENETNNRNDLRQEGQGKEETPIVEE